MRRILTVSYLVALVFFAWGYAMVRYEVFPWRYFSVIERNFIAFIKGDPEELSKTAAKVLNDLDIRPGRHLFQFTPPPDRTYSELDIRGLNSRRMAPLLHAADGKSEGYRLIHGVLDYSDTLHASILMDGDGQVIHRWIVDRKSLESLIDQANRADGGNREYRPDTRRLTLALDPLPDGSLVINGGHGGNGLHRIGFCSELLWSSLGDYDHGVSLGIDSETVWAFRNEKIIQLALDSGEVIREITVPEISRANPDVSAFTTRRLVYSGRTLADPFHANDIEPLPAEIANAFPAFEAGDLLIHHRSVNLVFVLDPDDLKIKWYRLGFSRLGHDPDWQPDGTITIYDNNMRESARALKKGEYYDGELIRYTRLLRIDPATFQVDEIYNGSVHDVYSVAKGTHQLLPNGNILFTSPHQGRVLEITSQGELVFELVNRYDEDEALILTEARWLPPDFFEFDIANRPNCPQ